MTEFTILKMVLPHCGVLRLDSWAYYALLRQKKIDAKRVPTWRGAAHYCVLTRFLLIPEMACKIVRQTTQDVQIKGIQKIINFQRTLR